MKYTIIYFRTFALCLLLTLVDSVTRDQVVHADLDEHDVFLTGQDFNDIDNFEEIDLESIGISVPNDPTLTGNKFEGDIVGFNNHRFRKTGNETRLFQRAAVNNQIRRWPNGEIPYVLSSRYGEYSRKVFAKAFKEYASKTCVNFVPKTSEHRDYIYILPDDGCYSLVGRVGGRQPVSLDEGCIQFGTIVHELMHTTGFFHEQSRPDRDEYVEIVWQNIDRSSKDQFEKYTVRTVSDLGMPYDYGSIMHYGAFAFTKNGRRTIEPLKAGGSKMGQRDGFSPIDIQKLNKLYECKNVSPVPDDGDDDGPTTVPAGGDDDDDDDEDCTDRRYSCRRWAQAGDCDNDREYMRVNCPKTCGFCGGSGGARPTTTPRSRPSTPRSRPTVTTVEPSSTTCENKKPRCLLYAQIGFCETEDRYMRQNCAKACGFCQPTPNNNRRKPVVVATTTPGSGGVPAPTTGECEDKYKYSCALWAKLGSCESKIDYMRERCPKTCGLCGGGGVGGVNTTATTTTEESITATKPPTGCRDRLRRCTIWAQAGNCLTDRAYMRRYCPESCNSCHEGEDGNDSSKISSTIRPTVAGEVDNGQQCRDDNPNCPRWAEGDFCNRDGFSEFVKKTCAKSCGICNNNSLSRSEQQPFRTWKKSRKNVL